MGKRGFPTTRLSAFDRVKKKEKSGIRKFSRHLIKRFRQANGIPKGSIQEANYGSWMLPYYI